MSEELWEIIEALLPEESPKPQGAKAHEKASREASRLHRAYDEKKCARTLRERGIKRRIARKKVESSEKLGLHRRVVEWALWRGPPSSAGSHDPLRAA